MALDGCGLVCKYILIIFNIIFAVVGFAFLGLGLWLRISNNAIFEIEELNSSALVIGVTVLIALGSVMLIVVSFGDYGACNEKRCALQVFSVLVSLMAMAEIVVGVLAYSRSKEVGMRMAEFYTSMYMLYVKNDDKAIAITLTFVHKMLHCCGLTGVPLIEVVKETCPKPDGFWEHLSMPGCATTIANVFESKAPLMMGFFVGTGVLLLVALICSSTLSQKIRQAAASPQYIILTTSTPTVANVQLPQQYPDQDPVVFTPLTVAHIPVPQA